MARIKLTKDFIKKAIREETKLASGDWYRARRYNRTLAQDKDCSVCAVGAVMLRALDRTENDDRDLRNAAYTSTQVHDVDITFDDWRDELTEDAVLKQARSALRRRAPMNALSILFEGLCDVYGFSSGLLPEAGRKKIVRKLLAFVETQFPSYVIVDVDGATPAKDVPRYGKDPYAE